jgi:hypothetical protein
LAVVRKGIGPLTLRSALLRFPDASCSGFQMQIKSGYSVPQVIVIRLPTVIKVRVPLVVRPEEVEPYLPGLRHRPFELVEIGPPLVPAAGRDVGVVAYLRPEVSFLGRLGDQHPVDEQVVAHSDAPDDQVMPVSKLADVEIERVRARAESHAISLASSRFPKPHGQVRAELARRQSSHNCK